MLEIGNRDPKDYGWVPNRVNLYAIHLPHKDEMELQLMLGHFQGGKNENIMYHDFKKLKIKNLPSELKIKDLHLFDMSIEFFEDLNDQKSARYMKDKDHYRQFWEYQLRLSHKKSYLGVFSKNTYYYFEQLGKFRPILDTPNIFIFNLGIVENKEYKGSEMQPDSTSIIHPLHQNSCYIISLIESKKTHLLKDFITQYNETFPRIEDISKIQIDRFYETIQGYLEKKYKYDILSNFEEIQVLTSCFGLLPRSHRSILSPSVTPSKILMIIKGLEKHSDSLEKLESGSAIYKAVVDGLAMLLLVQETKLAHMNLLDSVKSFSENKKFFRDLIQVLFTIAADLDVNIKSETLKGLQEIMDDTLLIGGTNRLNFASSYADFVKSLKEILLLEFNERKKVKHEEKDVKMEIEEPEANKLEDLPKKLMEEEKMIFEKIKKDALESLNKFTKRQSNYAIGLEDVQLFLKEIFESPEYLADIFENNDRVGEAIKSVLDRIIIVQVKDLEKAYDILIKYYNPFLLRGVNRLNYMKNLACMAGRTSEYYLKIFPFFLTNTEFDLRNFEQTLQGWLGNVYDIDRVLVSLDLYCDSFDKNDKQAEDKKEIFINRVIQRIPEYDFKDKVDVVFRNIKDKHASEVYKNRFIKDIIQKNIDHLNSTTLKNPLIVIKNLKKKYPLNKLLEELNNYCLAQVPKLSEKEVLEGLFEDPQRDSFLYMILTDHVFKNTQVWKDVNKICLLIVNQMQEFGLELKWINTIQKLSIRAKNVMEEQLKTIVDQNNLTVKGSDEKLNVKKLIEEAEVAFKERLSMIDRIRDFISAYCLEAEDAQEYVDILVKIRDRINEKRIIDLEFPEKLKFFADYAKNLNPFIYSISFETFRKKEREGVNQILDCKNEAEFAEKLLGKFAETLKALSRDDRIPASQISEFFRGVRDVKKEAEILAPILDENESEYLFGILAYLKEKGTLKRISKGIKSCLKLFDLSCDFSDLIEAGCNLSTKSEASNFYKTCKAIHEKFNLDRDKEAFKVLAEFEGADELLAFTFARTNKSEIDFMKEAVNDYDESHISTQAIFDFTNFWNYIVELNEDVKGKSLNQFLRKIQELSQNQIYGEIIANFKTSKVNFYGIQNLYLELTHKEEAKRKQIFKIINESSVRFTKPLKKFDIELRCETRVGDKQTLKSSDIFELRDRANLIVYSEQKKIDQREENNYKEEELERFRGFCSLTEVISQIINTLNNLNFNGYPELEALEVTNQKTCVVDTDFICFQNRFESLLEFKEQLEKILKEWNDSVVEAYKYYYELTYLKGKDFWKVEKALVRPENKSKTNSKGLHLLHYIGKKFVQVGLNLHASPKERLINLGEALKDLPNIYKPKRANEDLEEDKYYFKIVEVSEVAIIKGLLTLYLTFEKALPLSSQLLVCHASTSWNELVAFAFRCFFDPNKRLFCLIQPERLSFSFQDEFSALVKRLNNEYPQEKFQLAFVTLDLDTHLIRSFNIRGQTKILKSSELLSNDELKKYINKKGCCTVTSEITGLGKTTWAKKGVTETGLKYCKIPISGKIYPIEIGKRLLPVLLYEKPALCFTLGSIDKEDRSLLNEILFSLVVLKSFHFSKNVIEIPQDIQIIFEIDSSYFENLVTDIEILGYLQSHHINEMNFNELEFRSPKIQFVCHYIKGLLDRSLGTRDLYEDETRGIVLDLNECLRVLLPKFLEHRDKKFASYTQLTIFTNVLYSLFKSFSESGFFCYSILSQNANQGIRDEVFMQEDIVVNMRLNLIEGLILAADQFTSKSVENVRRNQNASMQAQKQKQGGDGGAGEFLSKAVVSWENTRPFSVVFTSDKSPIFVYKNLADIPEPVVKSIEHQIQALSALGGKADNFLVEYKNRTQIELFERLANLTNLLHNRHICLKCYKKYERNFDKCVYCGEPLLLNQSSKDFIERIAVESSKDYALTPDNFIKMLLIFTRVQEKIPVIIMGETGCGKTSLVRYLCSRILDDKFHIFSIHAGVNQEQIVEQMNTFIEEALLLSEDEIKLWIFFDEFNTTSSIGLIKEIVCERTMLGNPLPENMIFLGACNPWRLKTQQIIFDDSVGIKKDRLRESDNYNLLYTVHPLPETMIDYVWDYGHLDADAEKKYVEAMFSSLEKIMDPQLKETMVVLVCAAQQQFKRWEDVSSVSLRDVARYKILFKWFSESTNVRNNLKRRKKQVKTLQSEAAVLALLHCYYLRISSKKRRIDFLQSLEPQLSRLLGLKVKDVQELLQKEEDDFLNRMKLPEDIAKNQALKENVFALIVCILTKIPIFICGKPGCSKSLAVQLVFNNLRGKNSQDEYFRTLPELIPVSYQGSEYCTSESILGVFNRAEKYLNVNTQNKEILPVIIFDEIGLAELSASNPLKVLHNKLEIENIKVSFVGISNWRLDASKMNRALYLARPDPDEEDLVFTAEAICGKNINLDAKNSKIIKVLAKVYCNLRDRLKEKRKEDIFGLRDYYFLIKGFTWDVLALEEDRDNILDYNAAIYSIIRKNLKKNFSGLGDEPEYLWKEFCLLMGDPEKELQIQEPSARELILNNLSDRNSRYLMVITKSDCVAEYIEEIIRNKDQKHDDEYEYMEIQFEKEEGEGRNEVKTLVGSYMPEDLSKQAYGFRVLSDIILYIEKGYTLMFKKIDRVYSSLYDLFNQSFSWSGDKKYCRVALGALYNPKCLVHKDFHCVIFISESEVEKADPPFLNRFEKYKLQIEDILNENERLLKDELENWVVSITEDELISPKLVFVNYDSEYLFSLILKAKRLGINDDEKILEFCQRELIQTASGDFPVIVSLKVKNEELKQSLIQAYYELKQVKFREFTDKILQDKEGFQKNIVYTYTQISDDIMFSNDGQQQVKELKLGSFKSENEVIEEVTKFFNSKNQLLVIRIDLSKESEHLLLMKHLLLNAINNNNQKKGHHLMIIVHLQRFNAGESAVTTLFQDWQSIMFDDLNEEFTVPFEYMENPSFIKLSELKMLNPLESLIPELFDKCLSKVKYHVEPGFEECVNPRRNKILSKLKNAKVLWDLVMQKIQEMISKDKMNMKFRDWRKYILSEEWVRAEATSTVEAVNLALSKYYEGHLMKIVYNLEKNNLFDAYVESLMEENQSLLDVWHKKLNEMYINVNERLNDQVVEVNLTFGIVFPFSTYEEVKIKDIQENEDEVQKKESPDLYNLMMFERFVDTSFFGEQFYSDIFGEFDLFKKYFNDQLLLYLKRNKIEEVTAEIADNILESMFMKNSKSKFQYFLTNSKEFSLVLGVIEGLLTLKDGKKIMLKCLNGFYNLNETPLEENDIKREELPKFLLIFKEGSYYNVKQEDLSEEIDFDSKDESDNPFVSYLFQNIVEEISSCDYLAQFKDIADIKIAFRLIEEKMIKTGIYPDNLESFRPWICLMQFLEFTDQHPSARFNKTVEWLKEFEEIGIFSVSKSINKLIEYLRANVVFVKNLNKSERERKIVKLQTQLYKNLVNLYDDEYFQQVVEIIDQDPELWKISAQIVDSLDHYSTFSLAVMECNGKLEDSEYNSGVTFLEDILLNSSGKIAYMLANKAFVSLKTEWQGRYQEVLTENFESFKDNLLYFEKVSKLAFKKDWKETPYSAFLVVVVWLKAYLFYYAQALEKDERDLAVLKEIDIKLCELSPELATLKLYVLKNLQLTNNRSLKDLRREYSLRNIQWIKPFLKENPNKKLDILAPLPLYQKDEYKQLEDLLNEAYNFGGVALRKFVDLCQLLSKEYNVLVCVYAWFMKLYVNYSQPNYAVEAEFIRAIENEQKNLRTSLGDKGYEFIVLLLENFGKRKECYFYLYPEMKNEEIYQRLAALNLISTFVAQMSEPSSFGQIFFKNGSVPKDFAAHMEQFCLFGQLENNFIVTNMKDVKMNIERRQRQNLIIADAHYIYKCGPNCDYMYYFEGCGRPIEKSICKVCGSEIGAMAYNTLLVRGNGQGEQIRMPIPEGMKFIDDYIKKFEGKERKGYLFNPVNENAKIDTKQDLKPITFRTLHFILHAVIFGFRELGFITDNAELGKILKMKQNIDSFEYFKQHFLQDYKMIGELLGTQETHIWIYQLLAVFEGIVREKTPINNAQVLSKLEKNFEDQVIYPVIQSVNTVIQKYKQNYVEYHKFMEEEDDITVFIDELRLDQTKYPWLEFFNFMRFPDFIDFSNQFALLIGDAKNFPLLDFVLKRHEELANITSLPTIVDFTNNLMKRFNYQISRDKASTTLMSHLFEEDDQLKKKFGDFENSWNRIQKVQTVRVGCQEKQFKKISDQDSLSLLLPNNNKDESGLIVLGTMIYLAILQNEFIYTAKRANNPNKSLEEIIAGEKNNMEIMQTVQTDQVIHINKNLVMTDIIQSGYIHNFEYGKGREIIYDFEEIENRLHQYTNGKKIIDENQFILMNYQFELYPTVHSIITDIRKKNPQESLSQEAKAKYRNTIKQISKDSKKDLLAYLGSLDYVFTYLRNIKENGEQSIEEFCKEKILNYQHLNEHVIRRQPLSTVSLKYILDLYQTLEEVIFDEAIQDYIRPEFLEQIPEDEKASVIELFEKATLKRAGDMVYPKLKEPGTLVKVFKRLILRILLAGQVEIINNRLLDYFAREDMWEQDVDINEIQDVELDEKVQLRHAYIILRHLEAQIVKLEQVEEKKPIQFLNQEMMIEMEQPKLGNPIRGGQQLNRGGAQPSKAKDKKNRKV